MIFRPRYIFKLGYFTIPMVFLLLSLALLIATSTGRSLFFLIGMLIILILIIIGHRLLLYRYGERVILSHRELIVKNMIAPIRVSKVFRLEDIHSIGVVKFYTPRPNPDIYIVVFNVDLDTEDNIALTKQNSFTLKNAWRDDEILDLLHYIKGINPRIKVTQKISNDFRNIGFGSSLRRNLF